MASNNEIIRSATVAFPSKTPREERQRILGRAESVLGFRPEGEKIDRLREGVEPEAVLHFILVFGIDIAKALANDFIKDYIKRLIYDALQNGSHTEGSLKVEGQSDSEGMSIYVSYHGSDADQVAKTAIKALQEGASATPPEQENTEDAEVEMREAVVNGSHVRICKIEDGQDVRTYIWSEDEKRWVKTERQFWLRPPH